MIVTEQWQFDYPLEAREEFSDIAIKKKVGNENIEISKEEFVPVNIEMSSVDITTHREYVHGILVKKEEVSHNEKQWKHETGHFRRTVKIINSDSKEIPLINTKN